MKKLTLFIALVCVMLSAIVSQAQTLFKNLPARMAFDMRFPDGRITEDELKAVFVADTRSGYAPLTVAFTDQSTGEIQGWSWLFGDGQTSEDQNPEHTYLEPGTYSVSLTVTDGTNHYTLEKEDYIRVNSSLGECDTLDFPFSGTYTYYVVQSPGTGYISGTNSYGDLAKANFFNPGYASLLSGVFVDFAVAKNVSGTNPDIKIAVWNNAGSSDSPGQIIGYKEIPLSSIIADVSNDVATWVLFDSPIGVGNNFYVGVVLPTTNDTLAFWTDTSPESAAGKGWEQWYDQSWHAYSSDQSWGLRIANAIHPVICQVSSTRSNFPEGSIAVYPVPAREILYVSVTENVNHIQLVELYDVRGKLMVSEEYNDNSLVRSVPLQSLPDGIYMIKAVTADYVLSKKILISK